MSLQILSSWILLPCSLRQQWQIHSWPLQLHCSNRNKDSIQLQWKLIPLHPLAMLLLQDWGSVQLQPLAIMPNRQRYNHSPMNHISNNSKVNSVNIHK